MSDADNLYLLALKVGDASDKVAASINRLNDSLLTLIKLLHEDKERPGRL